MFTGLALYVRGLMSNRVLCRASLATVPHTGGRQHSYTLPYSRIQNSLLFQDRELNRKIATDASSCCFMCFAQTRLKVCPQRAFAPRNLMVLI